MTEIRFIEPDEIGQYRRAIGRGFGFDPVGGDDDVRHFEALFPVETSIAAFDRGHLVATFGSFDLDITVPGQATVATAGTTVVTVQPTHRRRGILTEMMRRHLDQAVERGQVMAGLWASEERIYGRFGYGPAAAGQVLRVPDYTVAWAAPHAAISVHPLTDEEAADLLPALYDRWRRGVAGSLVRPESWWEHRVLYDPRHRRSGATALRHVMAEQDGEPVGYLSFRQKSLEGWGENETVIVELVADDDEARRALWNFVTNVDLYRNVSWWNAPVDDPVIIEADRFRKIERTLIDSLWLRPLDVAAMLEARRYERDGTIVLGIHDRFGPTAGRYRLEVVDGVGTCRRTDDDAEVDLAVETLGRLYLGGGSAVGLARAGLIEGSSDAVGRVHDLLMTRLQPYCPEVF